MIGHVASSVMFVPATPGRGMRRPWTPARRDAARQEDAHKSPQVIATGSSVLSAAKALAASAAPSAAPSTAPNAVAGAAPPPPKPSAAPAAQAAPSGGASKAPWLSRRPVPMTTATAQRRVSWNLASLALLYIVPSAWPGILDVYYDLLEALVHTGRLPDGADELLDATLTWLRYALTIVFVFNMAEALLVRPAPPPVGDRATEVGAAFARSVSSGSPLTRPDLPQRRHVSGVSAVTPATPHATPQRSPGRSVSPFRASPYALGRGRPSSTPFSQRSASGTPRRTPSHRDAFAGRSVSRTSPGVRRSPSMQASPPGARSELGTLSCSHRGCTGSRTGATAVALGYRLYRVRLYS